MKPNELIEILIQADTPVSARSLIEVSIHLPLRGTRWVASFRDETGRQVWRTTGMRNRKAALALAQQWERAAKRKRAAQGDLPREPIMRVRPGSGERELGLLSQREVGLILKISTRAVREIEGRAFDKIRRHPALRDFWREWTTGDIKESALRVSKQCTLSRAEIAAVYALAQTPIEKRALQKLLALIQTPSS